MMQNTRQVVLFIVEGQSDMQALENIFKKIYRNQTNIRFKVVGGDITSDDRVTVNNVEEKIRAIIRKYVDDQKLRLTDICQVIQIFDMDGAYIPDSNIACGSSDRFVYSLMDIKCDDVGKVKGRNKHKREILDYLNSRVLNDAKVANFPYEMYFMSCNLDHALYNEQNLDENAKMNYADQFYERFVGREHDFVDFLNDEVKNGVPDNMRQSWQFIKQDLHSLERHTNLHIYFVQHDVVDGLL